MMSTDDLPRPEVLAQARAALESQAALAEVLDGPARAAGRTSAFADIVMRQLRIREHDYELVGGRARRSEAELEAEVLLIGHAPGQPPRPLHAP